jgi:hypothetical protein
MNTLLRKHTFIRMYEETICFAMAIGLLNAYKKNKKDTSRKNILV